MGGIELKVVVMEDGTVQIFGNEGPFADAAQATQRLLALLVEQGVPIEQVGEVEQHRPDIEHVHLESEVRREQ